MPGVSDAFGAALWGIDFIFQTAHYNCAGLNFHSGETSIYGAIVTDYASGQVQLVRSMYYAILAFSLIAGGRLAKATVNGAGLLAYAIARTDGSYGVILANRDRQKALAATLTLPSAVSQASSLLLTAPTLDATSGFTLGGAAVGLDGSWAPTSNMSFSGAAGNTMSISVPAGSAQIVMVK